MPVVNPLLIVIFIPIFEFALYPLFKKYFFFGLLFKVKKITIYIASKYLNQAKNHFLLKK